MSVLPSNPHCSGVSSVPVTSSGTWFSSRKAWSWWLCLPWASQENHCEMLNHLIQKGGNRILISGRNGNSHKWSQNIEICAENLEQITLLLFLYKENADKFKLLQIMIFLKIKGSKPMLCYLIVYASLKLLLEASCSFFLIAGLW